MKGYEYNSISLIGNISNISDEKILPSGKKYRFFDICQNDRYFDKNNTSFFSVRVSEDQFSKYESLLKIGNLISLKGKIKSYLTKDMIRKVYIFPEIISEVKSKDNNSKISYDSDGVMLWDGQRCEATLYDSNEVNEMEELLCEYR